jgi:hypothetical protein
MKFSNWGERTRASTYHFIGSILVLGLVAWFVLQWCYPAPYSSATGGYRVMQLIASVDAILGPAITFFVFDRAKKSLRKDLLIVVLLQIGALGYGVYAAVQGRPVFQTFLVDRFEILAANEVDATQLSQAPIEMRQLGFGVPKLAIWRGPNDEADRSALTLQGASGIQMRQLMSRYQAYEPSVAPKVLARAKPIDMLAKFNSSEQVAKALDTVKRRADQVVFVPVDGRTGSITALLDAKTGAYLATVNLDPWGPE